MKTRLDVEIYDEFGENHWAQARYLVHGYDDVLWTDDIRQVLLFLEEDLEKLSNNIDEKKNTEEDMK